MQWKIDTRYIDDWFATLDAKTRAQVFYALDALKNEGPRLKRPLVGEIQHSNIKNMKELRPGSSGRSKVRILFVFDPKRKAIMLVAGDKANSDKKWQKWYDVNIPLAQQRYEEYLQTEYASKKGNNDP